MRGAGFAVGLKEVVLSEYGHREQDTFLEEKRKGSRQVSFSHSFLMLLNETVLILQCFGAFQTDTVKYVNIYSHLESQSYISYHINMVYRRL